MFLLQYLTEAVGICAGTAGMLVLTSKFAGAVAFLPAGFLADWFRSRFGCYRPWIIGLSVPVGLAVWLAFKSSEISGAFRMPVLVTALVAFMILMSLWSSAYGTLMGTLSNRKSDRVSLSSWRFVSVMVAIIIAQGLTPCLVGPFGTGGVGWRQTMTIYAILSVMLMMLSGWIPTERLARTELSGPSCTSLSAILRRPVVWWLLGTGFAFSLANAMCAASLPYYFSYLTAEPVFTLGEFNTMGQVATLTGVLVLTVRLGNRYPLPRILFFSYLAAGCLSGALWMVPYSSNGVLAVVNAFKSLAYAPSIGLFWTLVVSVAGQLPGRPMATMVAFACFVTQVGEAVGQSLYAFGFALLGFVSGATLTPSCATYLCLSISVFPAVCFLVASFCSGRIKMPFGGVES